MMSDLTASWNSSNVSLPLSVSDAIAFFSLENEFNQIKIYNEFRQKHLPAEYYRHFFGVVGCLLSTCGVVGKKTIIII